MTNVESGPSPSPSGLGRGMVARTRPRLGVPHRLQRGGAIGMIGRSTIGFGRIIASAGSARPTVTAGNLTSLSLRPPHAFWSGWAAGEPEVAQQPARSWTTAAATPRPQARRSAAPTSTAAPAARSSAPIVRKVDSLRRLLEQSGMIEPSADQPPEPAGPAPTVDAERPAAHSFGDRSSTSAGPTTAPGELARRTRPEPGAPGGQEGLNVEFPERPQGPTRRTPGASPRSSSDIDRFRDALSSRGLIEPQPQPSGTPHGSSADPIARRQAARPRRPRARRSSTTDRPPNREVSSPPIRRSALDQDRSTSTDRRAGTGPLGTAPNRTDDGAPNAGDTAGTGTTDRSVERSLAARGVVSAASLPFSLLPEVGWVDRASTTTLVAPPGGAFEIGTLTGTGTEPAQRPVSDRPRSTTVTGTTPAGRIATPTQESPAPSIRRSAARQDQPSPAPSIRRSAARQDQPSPAPSIRRSVERQDQPSPATNTRRSVAPQDQPSPTTNTRRSVERQDQPSPTTNTRRSVERHGPPSISPGKPPVEAAPTAASSATPRDRVVRPSDRHLRELGSRVGLPHTRSEERRPESTLSALLTAPPPVTVRIDGAARDASTVVRRREVTTYRRSADRPFVELADPTARRLPQPGSFLAGAPTADPTDTAPNTPFASLRARSVVSPGPGALQRAIAELRTDVDHPAVPAAPTGRPIRVDPRRADRSHTDRRAQSPDPDRSNTPTVPDPTIRRTARPDRPGHASPVVRPAGADPGRANDLRPRHAPADTSPITSVAADRTVAPTNVVSAPDRHSRSVDGRAASPAVDRTSQQSLADRFLTELQRRTPAPTQSLPAPFQPLAAAITGTASKVRIATDAGTRAALRSVGKRAATVGEVIHLERAPQFDMRAPEVLAHELTHVAHPSPQPRFFDDDHRGPEERMAEQVAGVIARSPVMPAARVPSQTNVSGDQVIRRSPVPTSQGGQAAGTISAAGLAAAIEGRPPARQSTRGSAGADSVVRRSPAGGGSTPSTTSNQVIRREVVEQDPDSVEPGDETALPTDPRLQRQWFEQMVNQSIDHILRRLEDRVIIDLERRGGRHWRNL